jgi:hypothetical protein
VGGTDQAIVAHVVDVRAANRQELRVLSPQDTIPQNAHFRSSPDAAP